MVKSKRHTTRLWEADSIIELLGKLDVEKLPPEEGRAVGECQAKAVEDWIAAYADLKQERANESKLAVARQ